MSRPYDGTDQWWREEIEQLAQIMHQGHIYEKGSWRTCPMASCSRVRAILDESESSEALKILEHRAYLIRIGQLAEVRRQEISKAKKGVKLTSEHKEAI
jgi:hypothetical protein